MKKMFIKLAMLIILVGSTGGKANIVPVNASYLVQDGIEYYIQTDKTFYNLGEEVEILFRVTNLRDEDVKIYCSQASELNLMVQRNGETVWTLFHGGVGYSPGVSLSPGEFEMLPVFNWDMKDDGGKPLEPGTYDVLGVMYNHGWNYYYHGNYSPTEIGVGMNIVPEPSSIVLFVAGAAVLNCWGKRKTQ